jgi:pyrimidine operon attenuation protein/uracil phosphoribosyltransferase
MENKGYDIIFLAGSHRDIGKKRGKILRARIEKAIDRFAFTFNKDWGLDWQWLKEFSTKYFKNRIDFEIEEEIRGMAEGLREAGSKLTEEDILAVNCLFDAESYLTSIKKKDKEKINKNGGCTSLIANGDYTEDGDYIIAHTTWWRYFTGVNFNHLEIIKPEKGNLFMMQSSPGLLFSGTDFYYNSRGISISETTLDGIKTYNIDGIPIFQRLRIAIEKAADIYEVANIISRGNTGAYANDYLIGDAREKKIGILEIGTYNHVFSVKSNGYYVSSNLVQYPEIREESSIIYDDSINSDNARYARLNTLVNTLRPLNIDKTKMILQDHFDVSINGEKPGKNSICGHREIEERLDIFDKKPPFFPTGSIDGKITTGAYALSGKGFFKWGKPCGDSFIASDFKSKHPEHAIYFEYLEDIISEPWELIEHYW